jgi:hypothetical protein
MYIRKKKCLKFFQQIFLNNLTLDNVTSLFAFQEPLKEHKTEKGGNDLQTERHKYKKTERQKDRDTNITTSKYPLTHKHAKKIVWVNKKNLFGMFAILFLLADFLCFKYLKRYLNITSS